MNMNERTTIAAISTAMSNSGIGIVRMSGDQAFQIADIVYRGRHRKKVNGTEITYYPLWIYCGWRRDH